MLSGLAMARTVRRSGTAREGDSRNRGRPVGGGRPPDPATACRPSTTCRSGAEPMIVASGTPRFLRQPWCPAHDDHRADRRTDRVSRRSRSRRRGDRPRRSGSPRCASPRPEPDPRTAVLVLGLHPEPLRRGRRHHLRPPAGAAGEHRPARGGDHLGRGGRTGLRGRGRNRCWGEAGAAGSAEASRASTSAGVSGCGPGPSRPAPTAPTAVRPTTRAAPTAAAHAATPAARRVRALDTAPACPADGVARLNTALTRR